LDGGYWFRNLRERVLFGQATENLLEAGFSVFIEVSPHPVLTVGVEESIDAVGADAVVVGTLRRDDGGMTRMTRSLAQAWVGGAPVDWSGFVGGGSRVDVPVYPFQRRRFWLDAPTGGAGNGVGHGLLGASVQLAATGGAVFTGKLSTRTHPWLAEHAVFDTVLLPATAFVDIALRVAKDTGHPQVEELLIERPLLIADDVDLQVSVTGADLAVYSRVGDEPWTRHATGRLGMTPAPAERLGEWPPPGAEPVAPRDLYTELAAAGYNYGPALRGVVAAWRRGTERYAEVRTTESGTGHEIHPALLDAALHPALSGDQLLLPFSWNGITQHAPASGTLRVRLRTDGTDALAMLVTNESGQPVLTVDAVTLRPATPDQLTAASGSLYVLDWEPIPAKNGHEPDHDVLSFVDVPPDEAAEQALSAVQEWLRADRQGKLVVITRDAVAAGDLAGAAVWGLVRTAQLEHPDRIVLVDTDEPGPLPDGALGTGESQVIVRGGRLLAPRLVRAQVPPTSRRIEGPVLVTGASGALGTAIARHLVAEHGVDELIMVSRRGSADLAAELSDAGIRATFVACDVADREAVRRLVAEHPPRAVVHAAGVLDDGVFDSLTPEQLASVFGPKVTAARHLHDLTRHLELSAFVLFSSVLGTLGSPGQAAYTAANACLDALAHHRRQLGLPAQSIGWGLWARASGMTGHLGDADLARLRRLGVLPMSEQDGLALFDLAIRSDLPHTIAARLDVSAPAPMLSRLAPRPQRTGPTPSFGQRLAELPDADRDRALRTFVREQAAAVLGHDGVDSVAESRAFKEIGFDSLTAVELRNRLAAAFGLRLPATVAFLHPTPAALADHLAARLLPTPSPQRPERQERDRSDEELATATDDELFDLIDRELGIS